MVNDLRKSTLDPDIMNILIYRVVFLPTYVENWDFERSHRISLPIRKIIYGILLNFEDSPGKFVAEYDRMVKNPYCFKPPPTNCDSDFDLKEVFHKTSEEKKNIFENMIDTRINEDWIDDNLKGIFYCIKYWIKENGQEKIWTKNIKT